MDSDHPPEKSRKKNRRLPPNFGLENLEIQENKPLDFLTPSSRLSTNKKLSPDQEINLKHWAIVPKGFPPGVTVDELKKYGRRKQPMHLKPQDNLRLEEGSIKGYKSEYKRRYKTYAPLDLRLPFDTLPDKKKESQNGIFYLPEYRESYVNYPRWRPVLKRPQNNLLPLKDYPMESLTEKNSQYIQYPHCERRKLLRRSTALKPEGEMASETEIRKEYRGYLNAERTQMIRKLPSLKMEGELEPLTTEQRDNFITLLLSTRPILEKNKTTLKMEGDFDFLTEKTLSYVPHGYFERPIVRKRSTSLKLSGEVEFFPEYKNSFVDFPRTRPITYKPNGNLRYEGELEKQTEMKTQFVNFENVPIPGSSKPENNLHVEGEMETTPEYKINFVNFPRERPFLRRPLNQLKPEGNCQIVTENSEKFTDNSTAKKSENSRPSNLKLEEGFDVLTKETEEYKKHDDSDKPEINNLNSNSKLEGQMDFLTEKAVTNGILAPERETIGRRPSSLKSNSEFLFLPEYRRSYVDFGKSRSLLKPIQDIKSTPPSPRKNQKEKTKFILNEDKKSILGTPRRRPNPKRLKENLAEPGKILQFDVMKGDYKKPQYLQPEGRTGPEYGFKGNTQFPLPEILMSRGTEVVDSELDGILENTDNEKSFIRAKEFPAFQVLDVKGQTGCQSMKKEVLESEKSTSDEDNPTYRLEVFNVDEGGPGFHKNDRRVFPNTAIDPEMLKEAEERARRRAAAYVKIVKSPELPNFLIEENNNEAEKPWRASRKPSPVSISNNLEKRAFVVLDEEKTCQNTPKIVAKGGAENWMMSNGIDSIPMS